MAVVHRSERRHHLSIPWLIAGVVVLTSLHTVYDSCFTSLLPRVVGDKDLGFANARLSASQSTAGIAGPSGGQRPGFRGSGLALPPESRHFRRFGGVGGISPTRHRPPTERAGPRRRGVVRPPVRDVAEGIRRVRRQWLLSLLLGSAAVSNLCNGLNCSAVPLLATHTLGRKYEQFRRDHRRERGQHGRGQLAGRRHWHGDPRIWRRHVELPVADADDALRARGCDRPHQCTVPYRLGGRDASGRGTRKACGHPRWVEGQRTGGWCAVRRPVRQLQLPRPSTVATRSRVGVVATEPERD